MIISCPSCSTKYNFPDAEYREGRKVKCKMCSNVFVLEERDVAMQLAPRPAAAAKRPAAAQDELDDVFGQETRGKSRTKPSDELTDEFGEGEDEFDEQSLGLSGGQAGTAKSQRVDSDAEEHEFFVEDKTSPPIPEIPARPKVADVFGGGGGAQEFNLDAPGAGKPKGKKKGLVIALALFLGLALAGGGVYFLAPGLVGKYLPFGKSAGEEKPEAFSTDLIKDFALKDVTQYFVDNEKAGKLFVIQGKVVNNFKTYKDLIKIEATLFDKNGAAVVSKKLLIGNSVSLYQMQMMSEQELESTIENKVGVLTVNTGIPPGGDVPFLVVFFSTPGTVQEFGVKVIEAKDPVK